MLLMLNRCLSMVLEEAFTGRKAFLGFSNHASKSIVLESVVLGGEKKKHSSGSKAVC